MLRKLLKYECMATARTFGGLYLALLVTTALLGAMVGAVSLGEVTSLFSRTEFNVNGTTFSNNMMALGALVYACLVIAMFVLLLVTVCQRFHKNLLGSEGYLMHTLPVRPAALVASKLLVSLFWLVCSCLVLVVSLFVLFAAAMLGEPDKLLALGDLLLIQPNSYLLTMLPLILMQYIESILCVYLAMMVGHQFTKGAVPISIVAFFLLSAAKNSILMGFVGVWLEGWMQTLANEGTFWQFYWASNVVSVAYELVFAALFFAATTHLLRKRLNLA